MNLSKIYGYTDKNLIAWCRFVSLKLEFPMQAIQCGIYCNAILTLNESKMSYIYDNLLVLVAILAKGVERSCRCKLYSKDAVWPDDLGWLTFYQQQHLHLRPQQI